MNNILVKPKVTMSEIHGPHTPQQKKKKNKNNKKKKKIGKMKKKNALCHSLI